MAREKKTPLNRVQLRIAHSSFLALAALRRQAGVSRLRTTYSPAGSGCLPVQGVVTHWNWVCRQPFGSVRIHVARASCEGALLRGRGGDGLSRYFTVAVLQGVPSVPMHHKNSSGDPSGACTAWAGAITRQRCVSLFACHQQMCFACCACCCCK